LGYCSSSPHAERCEQQRERLQHRGELLLPGVAIALFPTPTARDDKGISHDVREGGPCLPTVASGLAGVAAELEVDWGRYGPAVRRWEAVLARPAPPPTIVGAAGQPKLSPFFVEWMMGYPPSWTDGVAVLDHRGRPKPISVNQRLRALGNAVVTRQAAAALRELLAMDLPSCIITDDQSSHPTQGGIADGRQSRPDVGRGADRGEQELPALVPGQHDERARRHDRTDRAGDRRRAGAPARERQSRDPRSTGSQIRRGVQPQSEGGEAVSNAPVQGTWGQVNPGDIVSPDGRQWFRVTAKTGTTADIHGPITPQDMTAGAASPGIPIDPNGQVWVISTAPASTAPPAAAAPTAPPAPAAEPPPVSQGAVSNDELAAGMIKLAKRLDLIESALDQLSAAESAKVTALTALARKR